MRLIKILIIMTALCITSCGIKGDPLPPAEQETIQKQESAQPPEQNPGTSATEQKKKVKK